MDAEYYESGAHKFQSKYAQNVSHINTEFQDQQSEMIFGRKRPNAWSHEEDIKLVEAVNMYGVKSWSMVAWYVGGGRSKSQCSQRWTRGLDPRLKKESWSK